MESEKNIVKSEVEDAEVNWDLEGIPNNMEILTFIKVEPDSMDEETDPIGSDMTYSTAHTPALMEHSSDPCLCDIGIKVEPVSSDAKSKNDVALSVSDTATKLEQPSEPFEDMIDIKIEPGILSVGHPKTEILKIETARTHSPSSATIRQPTQSGPVDIQATTEQPSNKSVPKAELETGSAASSEKSYKTELKQNGVFSDADQPNNECTPNKTALKFESGPVKTDHEVGYALSDKSSKTELKQGGVVSSMSNNDGTINESTENKTAIKVDAQPNGIDTASGVACLPSSGQLRIETEIKVEADGARSASENDVISQQTTVEAINDTKKRMKDEYEKNVEQFVDSQGTTEGDAVTKAKERIRELARAADRSSWQGGPPIPADAYAELENLARHPECKHSLAELKKMAEGLPAHLGVKHRVNFIRECYKLGYPPNIRDRQIPCRMIVDPPPPHPKCHLTLEELKCMAKSAGVKGEKRGTFMIETYHRGKDPYELLKQLSQDDSPSWCGYVRGKHTWSNVYAMLDKGYPHPNCEYTLRELKFMAEKIPESFGVETRMKFILRCYVNGKCPVLEDWTQYNVNPYYEFEDLPPHKKCVHSIDDLKRMSEKIPESLGSEARVKFVYKCYKRGVNPDTYNWMRDKSICSKKLIINNPFKLSSTLKIGVKLSEFEGLPPHHKCKYSLDKIKDLAAQLPESLGTETRVHFIRRCYRYGHDPMKEEWTKYFQPTPIGPPVNKNDPYGEFDSIFPHRLCTHSMEEIKRAAEQIPKSFGIETRVKFVRRCYIDGKDPATEDWTQYNIDPYFEIKERPVHPKNKTSYKGLKKMAERIPESVGIWHRIHFVRQCYQYGKNPHKEDWTKYKIGQPHDVNTYGSGSASGPDVANRCFKGKSLLNDTPAYNPPVLDRGNLKAEPKYIIPKINRSLKELEPKVEQIKTPVKCTSNLDEFQMITTTLPQDNIKSSSKRSRPPDNTEYPHANEYINRADNIARLAGTSKPAKNSDHHPSYDGRSLSGSQENTYTSSTFGADQSYKRWNVPSVKPLAYPNKETDPDVDLEVNPNNPYAEFENNAPHPECHHSLEELKSIAKSRFPESFESQIQFIRECFKFGKRLNQSTDSKRFSLLHVGGFSKFIRKFKQHKFCRLSIEELERIALSLPTYKVMKRFILLTYAQGKDPHQILEELKRTSHHNSMYSDTGYTMQSSDGFNKALSLLGSWQEVEGSLNRSSYENVTYSAAKDAWNSQYVSAGGWNLNKPHDVASACGHSFDQLFTSRPIDGEPSIPPANSSHIDQSLLSMPPQIEGGFHAPAPAWQMVLPTPPAVVGPLPVISPSNQNLMPVPPQSYGGPLNYFPATTFGDGHTQPSPFPTGGNYPINAPFGTSTSQSLLPVPPYVDAMPWNTQVTGDLPQNPPVAYGNTPFNFLPIPPPTDEAMDWCSTATTSPISVTPPIPIPAAAHTSQQLPKRPATENSPRLTANDSNYANQTDSYKHTGTQTKLEHHTSASLKRKIPRQEHIQPKKPITVKETPRIHGDGFEDDNVPIFIVSSSYPNRLSEEQMDAIQNGILEAILDIDDDSAKPTFKESFRRNGQYGFICEDEFTKKWLHEFLKTYEPWPNASLRLKSNESPKVSANAILPRCQDDAEKILEFIGKHNAGLDVSNWEVVKRWDGWDSKTCMNLKVDEGSAKALESCNRINLGLGSGKIFVVRKGSGCNEPESYSESVEVERHKAFGTRDSPVYRSSSSYCTSSDDDRSWRNRHSSRRRPSSRSCRSSRSSSPRRLGHSKKRRREESSSKRKKPTRWPSEHSLYDEDRYVRSSRGPSNSSSSCVSCRDNTYRAKRYINPSRGHNMPHIRTPSPDLHQYSKRNSDQSQTHIQPATSSHTMHRSTLSSSNVDLSEGELTPSPPPSPPRSHPDRPVRDSNCSPPKGQPLQDAATEKFRELLAAGFSRDKALELTQATVQLQRYLLTEQDN